MESAGRYQIIPYAVIDGEASLRPSFLRGLQARMKAEGLERWLFFDAQLPATLESLATSRSVSFFSAVFDRENGEPAGLFWLTAGPGDANLIHFCVFKKYWGSEARAMGRQVLGALLGMAAESGEALFPVIMGMTPANNKPAVRYAHDIGMLGAGTVPNVFYDAYESRRVAAVITYTTPAVFDVADGGE